MLPKTEELTKEIYGKLKEIEKLEVSLLLPEVSAEFPVCVINPPLIRAKPHRQYADLQFSIEAWHNTRYEVMNVFDNITKKLQDHNLGLRNSTVIYQDPITKKYRLTGSFEGRYNCITDLIEQSF